MPSRSNSSTGVFCARLKRADSLPSFTRSSPDANGDTLLRRRPPRTVGTVYLRRPVVALTRHQFLPLGIGFNSLPPLISVFLDFDKTEHLKFPSHGINKVILASADHQIRAWLRKLHHFNAVAPGGAYI